MPLPGSGPISASQVGTFVFNRSATAIFSLSASLSPYANSTKGYNTILGPIWVGNGSFDISNPQYAIGPNNLNLGAWYNYYKGELINITADKWETRQEACDDASESPAYTTEYSYWSATDGIIPGTSVTYTNTEGTTPLDSSGLYYGVYKINGAAGKWSGYFDGNGVLQDEQRC